MYARVGVISLVGVALAASAVAGRAWAGEPFSLHDALFGRQSHGQPAEFATPSVARYEADAGRGFVFDRADNGEALLKFDGDPEIWALKPTAASRGDIIYKNDLGEPVVRVTRLGGVTLFTPTRPEGSAAAFLGQAVAPKPVTVLGPQALQFLALQASARASRAAQHLIEFDAPEITPVTEGAFADAFIITSQAFIRVGQRAKAGDKVLARIVAVRFVTGHGPSAAVQGPTVQITVAPELGVAGRPSSERIAQVIARR